MTQSWPWYSQAAFKKNGTCACDEIYAGETTGNTDIQWNEHKDMSKESEPAKYLRENPNSKFEWERLLQARKNYYCQRRNPDGSFIAIVGPTLN